MHRAIDRATKDSSSLCLTWRDKMSESNHKSHYFSSPCWPPSLFANVGKIAACSKHCWFCCCSLSSSDHLVVFAVQMPLLIIIFGRSTHVATTANERSSVSWLVDAIMSLCIPLLFSSSPQPLSRIKISFMTKQRTMRTLTTASIHEVKKKHRIKTMTTITSDRISDNSCNSVDQSIFQ